MGAVSAVSATNSGGGAPVGVKGACPVAEGGTAETLLTGDMARIAGGRYGQIFSFCLKTIQKSGPVTSYDGGGGGTRRGGGSAPSL